MNEREKSEVKKWAAIGAILILSIGIVAPSSLTYKVTGLISQGIGKVWK